MTVFSLTIALPNNGGEKMGSTQGGMVSQQGFSVLVTGPQREPCLGGSRILNGPLWAVVTVSGCGQAWREVGVVEGLVRSWGRGESWASKARNRQRFGWQSTQSRQHTGQSKAWKILGAGLAEKGCVQLGNILVALSYPEECPEVCLITLALRAVTHVTAGETSGRDHLSLKDSPKMKFRIKTEGAKPMAIPPVTNVPVTGNFIMHCSPNLYHTHRIMHVLVLCQG